MTPIQMEALRQNAVEEMNKDAMSELAEHIDCQNLLSGQDSQRQAEDLRKVLMLAGLKVDTELDDPETMALISEVLDGLDPEKQIDEDEAMFACRFNEFERKDRKARTKGMEGGR